MTSSGGRHCYEEVESQAGERWPLLRDPSSVIPSYGRPSLHFGTKSLTIFIQSGMISRSVGPGGVGSANEHFFRAIPTASVISSAGEPNKRKRKPGKVMEMLRKISCANPLFHSGRGAEFVEMRRTVKDARLIFKPYARCFVVPYPLPSLSSLFKSFATLIQGRPPFTSLIPVAR